MKELRGDLITYQAAQKQMQGYLVEPNEDKGSRPGILVVPEFWGLTNYAKWRADMLADLGYTAMVVDLYGDGEKTKDGAEAKHKMEKTTEQLQLTRAKFEAAMRTLHEQENVDKDRLAAIGYCFGGTVALSMACAGYDLKAVMAFHASLDLLMEPSEDVKAKIVVANGAEDPMVSEEDKQAFKRKMESVGADLEYIEYQGVKHGYTNKNADELGDQNDLPLSYDKEADQDSWERLKKLLGELRLHND